MGKEGTGDGGKTRGGGRKKGGTGKKAGKNRKAVRVRPDDGGTKPIARSEKSRPGIGGAASRRGLKEAMFWSPLSGKKVQCNLCHHGCRIAPGKTGICRVRKNVKGELFSIVYGLATAMNMDPIEKKPLFHFHPGTRILSYGTIGCNFRCRYCQNHPISQCEVGVKDLKDVGPPEKPVETAIEMGCRGIAWTYNEPTTWYEYTYDASRLAKKKGLWVAYVSNGYIKEPPLRNLAPYLDAVNVDVKGFDRDKYRKTSGAEMDHVLDTCRLIKELGLHLEISYLVIPTHNDSKVEISAFCRWVAVELGSDVPVHFLRFHPDFQWTHLAPTRLPALLRAYQIALKEGLDYPYLGNIPNEGYEDTRCPDCDAAVILRKGHSVAGNNLKAGKCPGCAREMPIIV
jgi:pyruvate formate lyase activating enzyme